MKFVSMIIVVRRVCRIMAEFAGSFTSVNEKKKGVA